MYVIGRGAALANASNMARSFDMVSRSPVLDVAAFHAGKVVSVGSVTRPPATAGADVLLDTCGL